MISSEAKDRVISALSKEELSNCVVYLDEKELPRGARLRIDGREIRTAWKAAVAFVDREPEANWGHSCRYILVSQETEELQSFEAQFPPFLVDIPKTLHVIWKGDRVPDWTIVTS